MLMLGVHARRDTPVPKVEELDDRLLMEALDRHLQATRNVVSSSMKQVQRGEDITVAINSLVARMETDTEPTLRTAQGAFDLISMDRTQDADTPRLEKS
jgi:hypothetical protein